MDFSRAEPCTNGQSTLYLIGERQRSWLPPEHGVTTTLGSRRKGVIYASAQHKSWINSGLSGTGAERGLQQAFPPLTSSGWFSFVFHLFISHPPEYARSGYGHPLLLFPRAGVGINSLRALRET